MQEQDAGKELVLTPPEDTGLVRQRPKPTLVQIGNRLVSSDGLFHPSLAADYLIGNARETWKTVAELSRIFCGRNCIDGKKCVRKNMFRVFTQCLMRGEFLVYETQGNGRIHAVKLLDPTSEQERQAAIPQLERMKNRRQLTADKYERALQVIELQEQARV